MYQERKESERSAFKEKIRDISIDDLIYMDESGMDDNEAYEYGYSKKGERCYGEKVARKRTRTTFIAGYSPSKKALCATFCFEGYTNQEVFLTWIKECLLREVFQGKTLVMDNISFHHNQKVKEAIEQSGINILYLPTYSPDLNPIEKQWANLKKKIKLFVENMSFKRAVEKAFQEMRQPKVI